MNEFSGEHLCSGPCKQTSDRQRACSERLRKTSKIEVKVEGKEERKKRRKHYYSNSTDTKVNIASPRTSFNCSVYIKLEESYSVILQLHFTL